MSGKGKYKPGDKIGSLTLIKDTGKRGHSGCIYWLCRCECGKRLIRSTASLQQSIHDGFVSSCGCKKSKWIGKGLANDPVRKKKALEAIFPIDGTTLQGIGEQKIRKNNTSGFRGVSFKKKEGKWYARLMFQRKEYCKGFKRKADAIAYRKYLEDLFYEPVKRKAEKMKGGAE